jgi:hypothetical protein
LSGKLRPAIGVRDRFWTLVATRYAIVRNAAGWLYGVDNVNTTAPLLQSAHRTVKKPPAAKKNAASNSATAAPAADAGTAMKSAAAKS